MRLCSGGRAHIVGQLAICQHPNRASCPGAGHAYYFLEDVYPRMTGRRPLKTPAFVRAMFPGEEAIAAPNFSAAAPVARPPAPADAAGVL